MTFHHPSWVALHKNTFPNLPKPYQQKPSQLIIECLWKTDTYSTFPTGCSGWSSIQLVFILPHQSVDANDTCSNLGEEVREKLPSLKLTAKKTWKIDAWKRIRLPFCVIFGLYFRENVGSFYREMFSWFWCSSIAPNRPSSRWSTGAVLRRHGLLHGGLGAWLAMDFGSGRCAFLIWRYPICSMYRIFTYIYLINLRHICG